MSRYRYNQYHQLAADVLKLKRPSTAVAQLLEAAEAGNVSVCEKLLRQYKGIVDVRCDISGDTPLIAAARSQQRQVIDLLLAYSADCTLQNDNGESVLEVATPPVRKHILNSLSKSRHLTDIQQLLHSAWLGNAVSVKKSLTGDNMLDVNCQNSQGLTPLLLVTRDTRLFDTVHHAMSTEYDPLRVMEQLLEKNSNTTARDSQGQSALHLVANNRSIQAKKMVSLLLQSGADTGIIDNDSYTPLHVASKMGHTAIVVALIEEGNVDIDERGGDKGDTPLMLTASHGHKEATQYLLSKGADVTLKDNYGDNAMTLAKTPSLIAIMQEAWVKQTGTQTITDHVTADHVTADHVTADHVTADHVTADHVIAPPIEHMTSIHPTEDSDDDSPLQVHQVPEPELSNITSSFFLTERQTSLSSGGFSLTKLTPSDVYSDRDEPDCYTPDYVMPHSEIEADDEQEDNAIVNKRLKPATKRNQARYSMEEAIANKRNSFPREIGSIQIVPMNRRRSNTVESDNHHVSSHKNDQKRALHERLNHSRGKLVEQKSSHSLSRSMESLVIGRKTSPSMRPHPCTPGSNHRRSTLPSIFKTGDHQSNRRSSSISNINKSSSVGQLPNISAIMRPVALVSVDAENENLRVQKLIKNSPPQGTKHINTIDREIQRSKSLQIISHSSHLTKRNSVDTLVMKHPSEDKVPLLPAVITPELPTIQSRNPFPTRTNRPIHHPPPHPHPHPHPHPPHHPPPPSSSSSSPSKKTLSIVTEMDTESSSSSDKTATLTPEREIPEIMESPPRNLVINYAVKDSDTPLSPIWYMAQKSDSDTSSEYISSYIGAQTPFPYNLFSPIDHNLPYKKNADSGQGESEEEKQHSSTSDEETDEELPVDREILRWKRGRVLGRGAFGKVCEGLMDNAKLIAVKEIELVDMRSDKTQLQFTKIQQEVDILRSLSHKNIVQYFGASMDDSTVYIFMEFISGGSLQSLLKRFGSLDERTVAHYTRQITHGLEYLHNNGIIHRDIKGANIMVTSKGVVKLIDFGCAKRYCQDLTESFHSIRGTPFWMSPEVIRGQSYGRKSDIWSLGCTIHEMTLTKPPWGELPPEAAMFQIGIGQDVPMLPKRVSIQLKDIINQCLTREAQSRPTAKEILSHPFLSNEKQICTNRKSRKKH